jgi:hypothetical protein
MNDKLRQTDKRVCDICEANISSRDMYSITPTELNYKIFRGFSTLNLSRGPMAELARATKDKVSLRTMEANWIKQRLIDTTGYGLCKECYGMVNNFKLDKRPFYNFTDPKLFSGFSIRFLKYLIIYCPEPSVPQEFPDNFVTILCNNVGANLDDIFKQANVSYITGSNAGDVLEKNKKVPPWVMKDIESLYPEVKNRKQFPIAASIYASEYNDRLGLIVIIYNLLQDS